jgi:transcriptional regulator with XRE-family HTH domain
MSIGDNIKKWRECRNLKQSELAEMLGVSDKTVSSWEINRTEPKMGMVERISSALQCKKTDIIGIDETESSDDHYYINDETRQIAQEVFENPDLRSLFHVARDIDPEELRAHIDFMKRLKAREQHNDDEGC